MQVRGIPLALAIGVASSCGGGGAGDDSSTTLTTTASTSASGTDESGSGDTITTEGGCVGAAGCDCGDADVCDDGYVCFEGVCRDEPECGNGFPELWEQCDDGNDAPDDGCKPDCTASAILDWSDEHNGPDGNGDDEILDVTITDAGDVYVVGYQERIAQGKNLLISKFSFKGQQYWTREWNGPNDDDDVGYGIAVDSDDNVVVAGSTGTGIDTDIFVIKFDPGGAELWSKTVAGTGQDQAWDVVIDSDDDVIVVGQLSESGDQDIWVGSWYAAGGEAWTNSFAGNGGSDDAGMGIALDSAERVLLAGAIGVSGEGNNVWFAKLGNDLGSETWSKTVDVSLTDAGWGIAADAQDAIFVAATVDGGAEGDDIFVGKYDPSGAEVWTHLYAGNGATDDRARSLDVDSDGKAIVAGTRVLGQPTLADAWMHAIDTDGEMAWSVNYNGVASKDDFGWGIAVAPDDTVVLAGSHWSEATRLDGFVAKFMQP